MSQSPSPVPASHNNSAPTLSRLKISEKIAAAVERKEPFFSFEYFVPKTPDGA